jgi:hypothetical protein
MPSSDSATPDDPEPAASQRDLDRDMIAHRSGAALPDEHQPANLKPG